MSKHATMSDFGYVDSMNRRDDEDRPPPAGDGVKGITRYYGKYRGTVLPTPDPKRMGRLMVQVSDVNGPNITNWAHPCLPWAGTGMGALSIPSPGTKVWVEFEQGHPDYPIWVGCRWGTSLDAPTVAKTSVPLMPIWAVESLAQHALIISDTPVLPWLPSGGILLKSGLSYIAISPLGIQLIGTPAVIVNGKTQMDAALCVLGTP
jgi:Type VI secretion system/phage-baseplate injector OB domain